MYKITQNKINDNQIYNHFDRTWIDPYTWQPTESFVKAHSLKRKAIDFLWGLLACVMVFVVSLTIICGLFR